MSTVAPSFPIFARDGSQILAGVSNDPTPNSIALAREAYRLVLAAATAELRPPTGRYNCHGLVFAARRAYIPPVDADVDIDDVLRRDGYTAVPANLSPQVGDIVAYRLEGEIEHTGFVSRVEQVGDVPVVFVWSAWGGLGEFEHRVHVSPYKGSPEYWRLK
ncbi:MAG TPA: hypothetical protein VJN18_00715 [Polyangiaceae bacterium]|nr:hypothetical protein [Polyangiaceae bacterium]